MGTRHLFVAFLVAVAGLFSCSGLESADPEETTEDPVGYVTVDLAEFCTLTSVSGKDSEGNQEWTFQDGKDVRAKVSSWRCREEEGHIGYYVTKVELNLPDVATFAFPLERTEGDYYISGNKSVSGAHLNKYRISEDGKFLEFDLSITLYRETKGDIRIVWAGPILAQGAN